VIIAVLVTRMMEMSVNDVIVVIAVGNALVSTAGAVLVVNGVPAARV
jgi:hypothetical protein